MITVNVRQLVDSIREADVFSLPEMNAGTDYLYNRLYGRMARGEGVRLSEIDFTAFESDDITSLNSLYFDVFERNNYVANGIKTALRKTEPVCKPVCYA